MRNNRKATISKAVQAHPKAFSGGTSAPASAANGPRMGLGTATPAYTPQAGVGGALAPPKPGAPGSGTPKPMGTPLPWDSAYEQAAAAAQAKLNNTNIGLEYQRKALGQEYGIDPGFNDYQSNPYSRAALLEQSFKRANRGTTNSYAARGQLYAGSTQNAEAANRGSYDLNKDQLQRSYEAALNENRAKGLQAGDEASGALSDAAWKRVEAASKEELDPTTAPAKKKKSKKEVVHQEVSKARALPSKGKKK